LGMLPVALVFGGAHCGCCGHTSSSISGTGYVDTAPDVRGSGLRRRASAACSRRVAEADYVAPSASRSTGLDESSCLSVARGPQTSPTARRPTHSWIMSVINHVCQGLHRAVFRNAVAVCHVQPSRHRHRAHGAVLHRLSSLTEHGAGCARVWSSAKGEWVPQARHRLVRRGAPPGILDRVRHVVPVECRTLTLPANLAYLAGMAAAIRAAGA